MGKIRGIAVPHNKTTQSSNVSILPVPAQVHIPMLMHNGAPARPIVCVGDVVKVGQLIGEADGFVSSPVHASVSGTVKSIDEYDKLTGRKAVSITIASDGKQDLYEELTPANVTNLQEFLAAVRNSGVVGLGGAGYPTAAKLTVKETKKLDYILINAAECEPYANSDNRTMIEGAQYVYEGVELLRRFLQPGKIIICIEDNKPEAIDKMEGIFTGVQDVQIRVLPSRYPTGERKVLVYNVTGRIVPEGARLIDVGCLVINCSTTAAIARFVKLGIPLVQKVVTVDGPAVKTPKNVLAPIGTPIRELFEFCGGFPHGEPAKILAGGPMTGIALPTLDMPVVKITSLLLAFRSTDIPALKETACINCGRCVRNCPIRLMPSSIETAFNLKKPGLLSWYKVNMCIECGCCAYSCPARRPLVQVMQLSKKMLKAYKSAKKSASERGAIG